MNPTPKKRKEKKEKSIYFACFLSLYVSLFFDPAINHFFGIRDIKK
jgi:hypothetical protein